MLGPLDKSSLRLLCNCTAIRAQSRAKLPLRRSHPPPDPKGRGNHDDLSEEESPEPRYSPSPYVIAYRLPLRRMRVIATRHVTNATETTAIKPATATGSVSPVCGRALPEPEPFALLVPSPEPLL